MVSSFDILYEQKDSDKEIIKSLLLSRHGLLNKQENTFVGKEPNSVRTPESHFKLLSSNRYSYDKSIHSKEESFPELTKEESEYIKESGITTLHNEFTQSCRKMFI